MELNEVLNAALAKVNGNVSELARRCEVTPSAAGRWLSGYTKPDFDACLALAEVTGLVPDDILTAAGHSAKRLAIVRATNGRVPPPTDRSRVVYLDELDEWQQHAVEAIRRGGKTHRGRFVRPNAPWVRPLPASSAGRRAA